MANLLDYVARYGHLSFERKPFNEVDNLIFSQLAYLDYTETRINENNLTLETVGREYLMKYNYKEVRKIGVSQGFAYELLQKVVEAPRFRNLIVSDYIYDTNRVMMFSAMTFRISKKLEYIAFEGTDEQISGWREDFELACSFPVPSHLRARDYFNRHARMFGPKIITGGHSKGGNLALVGVMLMNQRKVGKIVKIYNNDGPGLRKKEFESPEFDRIRDRYVHIVPDCSIVGIMMRNANYRVVESSKMDILGHAIETWQIDGDHIKHGERSARSKETERRLWVWLDNHDDRERKKILEAVFGVIEGSNITDTMTLFKFNNIVKMIKQAKALDKESKDLVLGLLKYVALRKDK